MSVHVTPINYNNNNPTAQVPLGVLVKYVCMSWSHVPQSSELPAPAWLSEWPAPQWSPELLTPSWSPELPASPWPPESAPSWWLPELPAAPWIPVPLVPPWRLHILPKTLLVSLQFVARGCATKWLSTSSDPLSSYSRDWDFPSVVCLLPSVLRLLPWFHLHAHQPLAPVLHLHTETNITSQLSLLLNIWYIQTHLCCIPALLKPLQIKPVEEYLLEKYLSILFCIWQLQ